MARAIRNPKLDTRSARQKLQGDRNRIYYGDLGVDGAAIGYRWLPDGAKWLLRRYKGEGKYAFHTLGIADDRAEADGVTVLSFRQAQDQGRALHLQLTTQEQRATLPAEPADDAESYTVRAAIDDYLADQRRRGKRSVADARTRANALILPLLGEILLTHLTTKQLRAWRDGVAAAPPRRRQSAKLGVAAKPVTAAKPPANAVPEPAYDPTDEETMRRRRASANRTWTILRAALNHAYLDKGIGNPEIWRAVKPFDRVAAARLLYLRTDEATRLINATEAEPPFRDLVQAALATGARYGELCALRVRDFDPDNATVFIALSKSGKARHIDLTEEGVTLFTRLTAGRSGSDILLLRSEGRAWRKSEQIRPLARACAAANLPPINFHALRHTWASLAIMAGVPLQVAAANLGHADTRMVERHYGHLAPSYKRNIIRQFAPKFGAELPSVVVPLKRRG
jgi:integrase